MNYIIKSKKGLIKIIIKFRLRNIRLTHNVTQTELARKTNFSQSYISKLSLGAKSPTLDTVAIIATALGVCPYDLIEVIPVIKQST